MTGNQLAADLKRADISLSEFARRLGLARRTVVYWFANNRVPSKYADDIRDALGNGEPLAMRLRRTIRACELTTAEAAKRLSIGEATLKLYITGHLTIPRTVWLQVKGWL